MKIKDLFNIEILKETASRFGVDTSTLELLGNYQNYIYQYKKESKEYILRITHSSHRKDKEVIGELQWILYLSNNGISASKPIYSIYDRLTERINVDDSYFIITSFEKAMGNKIGYPECLNNNELFEKCGRITGKIHSLSKRYKPSSKETQRHEWKDNYYLRNIEKYIPKHNNKIYESYYDIVNRLSNLTKDSNSFGLIHGDINVGNFLVSDKEINIFDFDECQYSWFVEDIAIQLFYIIYVFLDDSINDREKQAYSFMESFMKGYYKENYIDEYWIKQIPLFLRVRELIVYIGMFRDIDFSNMNQWTKNYTSQSKLRIEEKTPIVSSFINM
ncbi:phosphotransferase enzyme family protein [Clostridium hydrogeniformans]|uniref:phosphotransferase enzyme family protein n=1 Tax=Clostridium hydrogeniformans TaxID=349933 RepID=UPI0009FFCF09|nr:phosphotransferase [Clostridium hydrogeniformans]